MRAKKDTSLGLLAVPREASVDVSPHLTLARSPVRVQPGLPKNPPCSAQNKAAILETQPVGITNFRSPVDLLWCFSKQQRWKKPSTSLVS